MATAAAQETSIVVGVASHAVLRGYLMSDPGLPSYQVAVDHYRSSGVFAGFSASTLSMGGETFAAVQVIGRLGYAWQMTNDWSGQVSLQNYTYRWEAGMSASDYNEMRTAVAYRDRLAFSVGLSPDTSGGGPKRTYGASYDASMRFPVAPGIAITAGLGYYDLERSLGSGYVYGNGGISLQRGAAQLDINYIATDDNARALFGDRASNRWTGSLKWGF